MSSFEGAEDQDFDGYEVTEPTPRDLELAAKLARWKAEALGDEEHIAHTASLLRDVLSKPGFVRDEVIAGRLSLEEVGTMASFVVSREVTDRNYGGGKAVGEAVVRLLPPSIVTDQ